MISKIEQAVVARLRLGLGRMVRTVKSYGGEVDDLSQQLTTFPAVWVTYGGSRVEAANTGKSRYREQAEMVVMVASLVLCHISFSTGRTNVLNGAAHLALFAAYLMTIFA